MNFFSNRRRGVFLPSLIQFFDSAYNQAKSNGKTWQESLRAANQAVENASPVLRVFWGK